MTEYADIDKLLSELRHGHSCLLLNENSAGGMTGFVVVAAEHCEAEHIAFMARQARGLVCLAMTSQRCEELELPLMVEGDDSLSPFTLSIEAATGIDTGISAADRARTVRVAVDAASQASDLVQPGHIFPIAAAAGGVLTRTAPAEAAMDWQPLPDCCHRRCSRKYWITTVLWRMPTICWVLPINISWWWDRCPIW